MIFGLLIAGTLTTVTPKQLFSYRWLLYLFGLLLLVLTLFFGKTVRSSRSWLSLGLFNLQASELMKVFLLMVLAGISEKIETGRFRLASGLLRVLIVAFIPVALILLQPDTGTALLYLMVLVSWFFVGGWWREGTALLVLGGGFVVGVLFVVLPLPAFVERYLAPGFWARFDVQLFIWLLTGGLFFLVGILPYLRRRRISMRGVGILFFLAVFLGLNLVPTLAPYQIQRIESFFAPAKSPRSSGYSLIQSQIAIGSGDWFGQGYMDGTQSQLGFIPELWTDFIFTVGVEELGFALAVVVILLYVMLIYGVFSAAALAEDWWSYYFSSGVGVIWIFHVLINIGMCVGLVPIIGLPLPLLSYGGSFMVTNWILVGMFLSLVLSPRSPG